MAGSTKRTRMSFDVDPAMDRLSSNAPRRGSSNIAALVIAAALVAAFLPLLLTFLPDAGQGGTELTGAGMADAALRVWHTIQARWF